MPEFYGPPSHRSARGACVLCGTFRESLHRDHIIPKVKGGSDEPENIQWLCANCHEDKTRKDLTGMVGKTKGIPKTEEHKRKIAEGNRKPYSAERRAAYRAAVRKTRGCPPLEEA